MRVKLFLSRLRGNQAISRRFCVKKESVFCQQQKTTNKDQPGQRFGSKHTTTAITPHTAT